MVDNDAPERSLANIFPTIFLCIQQNKDIYISLQQQQNLNKNFWG